MPARSADCGLRLHGYRGGVYVLAFEEFDVEAGDFMTVFDGRSSTAPQLGRFSGAELPPTLTSTGPDLYIEFTSNDAGQSPGFRAEYTCSGMPVEYWQPSDVATPLTMGKTVGGLAASSLHAECLDKVLLSVQCCADASTDCANARVVGLGLSGQQLRGSLPEAIGDLGALKSLKASGPI